MRITSRQPYRTSPTSGALLYLPTGPPPNHPTHPPYFYLMPILFPERPYLPFTRCPRTYSPETIWTSIITPHMRSPYIIYFPMIPPPALFPLSYSCIYPVRRILFPRSVFRLYFPSIWPTPRLIHVYHPCFLYVICLSSLFFLICWSISYLPYIVWLSCRHILYYPSTFPISPLLSIYRPYLRHSSLLSTPSPCPPFYSISLYFWPIYLIFPVLSVYPP